MSEPKTPSMPVDTRVGSAPIASTDLGVPGADGKRTARTRAQTGYSVEMEKGRDMGPVHVSNPEDLTDEEREELEAVANEEGAAEGDDEGREETVEAEPLPDWDPEDEAVVEAYDTALLNEKGSPNVEALSTLWTPGADGELGSLPENVYGWLEQKGYSKEFVNNVAAGQLALQTQAGSILDDRAGGKEHLDAAIEWAVKSNGYTPAQRERFNKAMKDKDPEARLEAIDVLMARFGKANPRAVVKTAVKPKRTVSSAGGSGGTVASGAKPFENIAEYSEARRAAKNDSERAEVTRRLRASSWARKARR